MRTRSWFVAIACVACGGGCSIRYDAAGVTRVGIGLWGFGDPPGVQWNLDAPRREIPELPAAPRPDLPPRTITPPAQWPMQEGRMPVLRSFERTELPIEDNHDRASRRPTDIACPLALRALDRCPDPARG